MSRIPVTPPSGGPRRTPSGRLRLLLPGVLPGAGLACAVLLAAALSGCAATPTADPTAAGSSTATPSATSATNAANPSLPAGAVVEEEPGEPIGIADVGGKAWLGLNGAGQVRTGEGGRVAVGSHPLRLSAAPEGGVWVSVFGDGALVRLSAQGTVLRRVPFGATGRPEGIASSGSELWVVDERAKEVAKLDSGTGAPVARYPVGAEPRLLALGETMVWVSGYGDGSLTGVHRTTGRIGPTRAGVCRGPQGVAVAAGTVWVACTDDHVVLALSATDLAELARFPLKDADAVTASGNRVYAVGQSGPTVLVVDAVGRAELGRVPLGGYPAVGDGNVDAAVVADALVVTHPEARRVWRVPRSALPASP